MRKTSVLIIGNGHYATGLTTLSDTRKTDKDSGVLLPSVLALKSEGFIEQIGIAARDGDKLLRLKSRLASWKEKFGWSDELELFPDSGQIDEKAYLRALSALPKPCVALIAVPDFLHKEVMLACISHGVPFLVVKPALIRLEDLYEVLQEIEKKPILGMVDYHKVFDEANMLLKSEYQAGEYGKLHHAYSLMTQRRDMLDVYKRWIEMDDRLNINHYLGSHYIHLTGFITGAEPIDVRATAQFGLAADILKKDVADVIETQIRWKDVTGHIFTSYHVSGWSDPRETESMTYQEIHLLCEKGHIDSDQRYRGLRKILSGSGYEAPNPYFFNLSRNHFGEINLNTRYGFISIKTFIEAATQIQEGEKTLGALDNQLPTLRESEKVTAVLEAADHSIANNSKIVEIIRHNGSYVIK
jgi:D-galacturonate reductase